MYMLKKIRITEWKKSSRIPVYDYAVLVTGSELDIFILDEPRQNILHSRTILEPE